MEVSFLSVARGRRFCVFHPAESGRWDSRAIVFVGPFAEELNKSRRMVALQACALAEAGWDVLRMDLFGCGDSDGEFEDASWPQWVSDVVDGAAWLREQSGRVPALWGLRSGCLLAAQAVSSMQWATDLLLWQPVVSGRQHLQQFLRLKVAERIVASDKVAQDGTTQLRERLAGGQSVEVAGYTVSPAVAVALEAAEMVPPLSPAHVAWFEVGDGVATALTPAALGKVEMWRAAGHDVDVRVISGPPFWQTQEIAECPALIEATVAAVASWRT